MTVIKLFILIMQEIYCIDVIAANEPMYVLMKIIANIVIVFIVVLLYKVNYLSRYII